MMNEMYESHTIDMTNDIILQFLVVLMFLNKNKIEN